jgi:hypothetical protein
MDAPTGKPFWFALTLNVAYGAERQRGSRLLAPNVTWLAAHICTVFFVHFGGCDE